MPAQKSPGQVRTSLPSDVQMEAGLGTWPLVVEMVHMWEPSNPCYGMDKIDVKRWWWIISNDLGRHYLFFFKQSQLSKVRALGKCIYTYKTIATPVMWHNMTAGNSFQTNKNSIIFMVPHGQTRWDTYSHQPTADIFVQSNLAPDCYYQALAQKTFLLNTQT